MAGTNLGENITFNILNCAEFAIKVYKSAILVFKDRERYVAGELPPSTSIRLDLGLQRFANDGTYAFPWHGGQVPILPY